MVVDHVLQSGLPGHRGFVSPAPPFLRYLFYPGHLGCEEGAQAAKELEPGEERMKKLMATMLTALLATAGLAQAVDDHAKAKKGAVVGGVAGAIAGAIIGN